MRRIAGGTVVLAFVVLALPAFLTDSASAATKKKKQPAQPAPVVERSASGTVIQPTRTIIHNNDGSTTVIVIPRRSYLDTGTEVSPGDRNFMDYMLPPGGDPGRPNWVMGPDYQGKGWSPLPGPFYIPGFNPYTPF
jgi:hypothetical protein